MKCTDMQVYADKMRRHAIRELKQALSAWEGYYAWMEHDDDGACRTRDDAPVVLCNHRHEGAVDIRVQEAWISIYGTVEVEAETLSGDCIQVRLEEDVVPYHIPTITAAILPSDEVYDVTIPMV